MLRLLEKLGLRNTSQYKIPANFLQLEAYLGKDYK